MARAGLQWSSSAKPHGTELHSDIPEDFQPRCPFPHMITAEELNRLQDASVANPDREPEFFRALLDATLYAHTPLHDDSPRLRFVMFSHPIDHALTIPVFTDRAKADFAARDKVRVVSIPGRLLLEATRGASLTINPNDTWCTLYPEEISDLLATDNIAPIRKFQVEENEARAFRLDKIPSPLIKALRKSLPKLADVKVAYVAGIRWQQPNCPDSLLIVLGGSAHGAEREVRATTTMLQPIFERLNKSVDMQHFNAADPTPDWIRALGLKSVYRRRAGVSMRVSPYN